MNVSFYLSYGIKINLKSHSAIKTLNSCHYVRDVVMDVMILFPENLQTTSGSSILLNGAVFTPRRDVI